MVLYKVWTRYMVNKELLVEVEEGKNPRDPENWCDIVDEHDTECNLYEVFDAEEYDDS